MRFFLGNKFSRNSSLKVEKIYTNRSVNSVLKNAIFRHDKGKGKVRFHPVAGHTDPEGE
jgi:hypothetical protein